MAGRDKMIAAEAKQYDGDAVICNSEQADITQAAKAIDLTSQAQRHMSFLSQL